MKRAWNLFWIASLTGCATVLSGSQQQMTFQSVPAGATVYFGDKRIGITPITVAVDRGLGKELRFEKEGYNPASMKVASGLNEYFLGNVLFGLFSTLGPSTTDLVSGSFHKYTSDQWLVTLEKQDSNTMERGTTRTPSEDATVFAFLNRDNIAQECATRQGQYLSSLDALSGGEAQPQIAGDWSGGVTDSVSGPGNLGLSISQNGPCLKGFSIARYSAGDAKRAFTGLLIGTRNVVLDLPARSPDDCPVSVTAQIVGNKITGAYRVYQCPIPDEGRFEVSRAET